MVSDQAGADAAEEVFAVGFGLFQDFGLVAIFQRYFLQEKLDGIFGLEALRHQFADARGEAVGVVGRAQTQEMVGAFVVAELGCRQAVKGGLGVGIVEQCGEWGIPFALRAGPAAKGMVGGPDQLSGSVLL